MQKLNNEVEMKISELNQVRDQLNQEIARMFLQDVSHTIFQLSILLKQNFS